MSTGSVTGLAKPCPFCENKKLVLDSGRALFFFVKCNHCGAEGPPASAITGEGERVGHAKDMAIAFWNGRSKSAFTQAEKSNPIVRAPTAKQDTLF